MSGPRCHRGIADSGRALLRGVLSLGLPFVESKSEVLEGANHGACSVPRTANLTSSPPSSSRHRSPWRDNEA